MTQKSTLAVERGGEVFELVQGETLRPGDRIINRGLDTATVGTLSKTPQYPSSLATLKPGQSVKVTDVGNPEDEVLGLEPGDGEVLVESATAEAVAAADFTVTPQVEMFDEAQGLFGVVPFLGGAGVLAAAGAVGLAALAGGSSSDSGGDGAGNGVGGGGNGGMGGTSDPSSSGTGGLVGGIEQLNLGLEQTPLEPLTALTGPLADGLGEVGGALLGADEPTGLGTVLGEVIGAPGSILTPAGDGGLVGLLNSVSTGLNEAVSSTPLEPLSALVEPLTQTLGATDGVTDGVAQGLANVGAALSGDGSVLAPLTSDLLGPVVGTSTGQVDGVQQTLTQVGEGLTDLTGPTSALAPLSALTQPVDEAVVQQLAGVVDQIGAGLADFSAQDPSGIVGLLSSTLSGDTGLATAGLTNPLDALGGATGLLGGGLATDALPVSGVTDLLGAAGGQSGISSGAGLPGLDLLTNALPV